MQFSICSTGRKKLKIEEVIKHASSIGMSGIEIWDGHIKDYIERNGNSLNKLKVLMDQYKIKCVTIAPDLSFIDKVTVKENIEYTLQCANYASALDCKIVRTFLGKKPSNKLDSEELALCISSLKEITAAAEKIGVCFAVETHNNTPADTGEALRYILDDVNSPNLKVIFDGFNYRVDNLDPMEAYKLLQDYTIHYHIKNYKWDERIPSSLQKGDVDFLPLMKCLKQTGYTEFLSFEYFCENQDELIRQSIEWIESIIT